MSAPDIAHPDALAELRRYRGLLFAARLVVEGLYTGHHRSPYRDASAEFADFRPYAPGDDVRTVDWRAAARTDRLFVKQFRKETDMCAYLALDTSASMAFAGEGGLSKFAYAAQLAAAMGCLMLRQGDRPALALCGERVQRFVPPAAGLKGLQRLVAPLERLEPAGATDLPRALRELFGMARRRGLLVVISDLLDSPEELFAALGMYLHRGFAVALFQVLTPQERDLPDLGAARFVDVETGAGWDADTEQVRAAYQAEVERHIAALAAGCRARGIHFTPATTDLPYHAPLGAYLSHQTRR